MIEGSSKSAEKEYLRRSGSRRWEESKPFSPPGAQTLHESVRLIHDFAVAVNALELCPGHRVLDLGAGACWTTEWLARLNVDVVAADISREMLLVGKERLATRGGSLVAGDMEALPFTSASFDRVVCMNALHHVPQPHTALAEIARVLESTGRVVFIEPGRGHGARETARLATQQFGVLEQDLEATDLMHLCAEAGFARAFVRPLSYMSGEILLDLDEMKRWRKWVGTKRPVRGLRKLWNALREISGAAKRADLFEDALGIWFSRVLQRHVSEQSVVVAFKGHSRSELRPYAAEVELVSRSVREIDLRFAMVGIRVRNCGTAIWRSKSSRPVQVGAQLLDRQQSLLARDFHRTPLHNDVLPDEAELIELAIPLTGVPSEAHYFRIDLVAEGVAWFETCPPAGLIIPIHELSMSSDRAGESVRRTSSQS